MSYETLTEHQWARVERIYDQLDAGEIEAARLEIDAMLATQPGHPDLRMVDAAVSLEEGDPERALGCLKGAERSADPAEFFHRRAVAAYELARFEDARADADRALSVMPRLAEAHDLLSRIEAHLGRPDVSEAHAAAAEAIDSEAFPTPLEVSDEEFDALVEKSLTELPERVRKELDHVPVLVEPLPSRDVLSQEKPVLSPDILGLFVGRHLLERSHDEPPAAPGAIYLFRCNLLRRCGDREELAKEIRITVQHEVGHLLGLDEDDLEEWGLA
jgi:predicted Zn-dependent protease with MMP-like domain